MPQDPTAYREELGSVGSRKQTTDQPGAGAWSQAGDRLPPTQGRVLQTQKPPAWAVSGLLAALMFSRASPSVSGDHVPPSSSSPGVSACGGLGLSGGPHTCAEDPLHLAAHPQVAQACPLCPRSQLALQCLPQGDTALTISRRAPGWSPLPAPVPSQLLLRQEGPVGTRWPERQCPLAGPGTRVHSH